jgi:hypothetical protein
VVAGLPGRAEQVHRAPAHAGYQHRDVLGRGEVAEHHDRVPVPIPEELARPGRDLLVRRVPQRDRYPVEVADHARVPLDERRALRR